MARLSGGAGHRLKARRGEQQGARQMTVENIDFDWVSSTCAHFFLAVHTFSSYLGERVSCALSLRNELMDLIDGRRGERSF